VLVIQIGDVRTFYDRGVRQFIDDDDSCLSWVARHPAGFVLNTYRRPRPSYLRLYRATCGRVTGTPANGEAWTTTYIQDMR